MIRLAYVLAAILLCPSLSPGSIRLAPGDPFPDIRFEGLVASEDYPNLGLARPEGPFSLSSVPGQVLVLDLFNKHCRPCRKQIRHTEAFFQELRASGLLSKIRLLGMAEGNQAKYFPPFRKKRNLHYPIAADPDFAKWRTFGEPSRTPFTIFLVRKQGRWVLAGAATGVHDKEWLFTEALAHLRGDRRAPKEPSPVVKERPTLPPRLKPAEEAELARRFLVRVAGTQIPVEQLDLGDGNPVFRTKAAEGSAHLYARVARREPLCEICHGVYFMFAFDGRGLIRGFEPIFVGRWNNEPWTTADAVQFESRLKSRMVEDLVFDEKVDAVARATVSSAIIFDEIRRSTELLDRLEQQ
jgi:thiol-disulfide isomerase/thioredoxin